MMFIIIFLRLECFMNFIGLELKAYKLDWIR